MTSQIIPFARFAETANGYEFRQLDSLSYAKSKFIESQADSFAFSVNPRFYYSIKLGVAIDYVNGKKIQLPRKLLPPGADALDMAGENGMLRLLLLTKNGCELVHYNPESKKTVAQKLLKLPGDVSLATLKFLDAKTLVFMNKSSSALYLLRVD